MRKNVVMMTVLMVALVFALMLVAVPAVGAGDGACDWTGTWDTCWGKMELVQTGTGNWAKVTGTAHLTLPQRLNITYKPEGKINGVVLYNTLEGVWLRYPSHYIGTYTPHEYAGDLVFIISEDCSSFEGKWWYGYKRDEDWDGVWTGSRVGPSKPPSKQTVCASAKPRIAGASEFKRAMFTIGGTEPQEVRITTPAENFGIVKEYGERVYQRIDGKSWGSLTLEPGSYILSCGGGGVMGLMSATVCIEYPGVDETPTGPEEEFPEVGHSPEIPEVPSGEGSKPSLPRGPMEKIIIRPSDNIGTSELVMEIGKEQRFIAWGEDAAGNKMSVTVEDWEVSDTAIGSIDKDGIFEAKAEGEVKIRATVKNQEGNDITGAFPITVSAEPPITFVGRIEFFDQNGRRLKPLAGVQVCAIVTAATSAAASFLDKVATVKITSTGEFKFVLPAKFKDVDSWKFLCWGLKIPAPSGYVWYCQEVSADSPGKPPGKPGKTYHLDPIECTLHEMKFQIVGKVTHQGKAVENAKVRLFDNGNCVKEGRSNYFNGKFTLGVGDLPKGSYRLTVKPYKPKERVGVHNLLCIKEDKWVDLPLKTETKTIPIEMISFAEKIGYTGP